MLFKDLSEEPLQGTEVIPRQILQNKKEISTLLDLVYLKLAVINSKKSAHFLWPGKQLRAGQQHPPKKGLLVAMQLQFNTRGRAAISLAH